MLNIREHFGKKKNCIVSVQWYSIDRLFRWVKKRGKTDTYS